MTSPNSTVAELRGVTLQIMGGLRRSGAFALRASTTLVTLIGGLDLDLTEAEIPPSGARITKISVVGGVSVVVGPDVRVDAGGFTLIGGRDVERVRDVPDDAPVVAIRAWGLVGGVRVRVADTAPAPA
jgi:hypothetical protein